MADLLTFFIILAAGLFFSSIFHRLKLPWVVALILAGVIAGPNMLGFFEITPTIEFFSQIGLVFLMFMAGLETKLSFMGSAGKEVFILALLNGVIPLLIAFSIGFYAGYDLATSFLLGLVFLSSSIAIVIPSLEASGLFLTRLGNIIIGSVIIEDILSLLLLSLLLQTMGLGAGVPLPILYAMLFASLIAFRWIIPFLKFLFIRPDSERKDIFEREPRIIFAIILGTVLFFEMLGLHAIISGFFVGLILSESIKSDELKQKLHAISYGIFIPVFFIVVGAQTDLGVFLKIKDAWLLALVLILGSILSKFISGFVGGKMINFSNRESILIGSSTIPQLSTTLAVVYIGYEMGILSETLLASLVMLSIVTTVIGPIFLKFSTKNLSLLKDI